MTERKTFEMLLVSLTAAGTLLGAVGLAAAAPSKYEAARRAAHKFDGRRKPSRHARALPAAPRAHSRKALAPHRTAKTGLRKQPQVHRVSPNDAATTKLTLQSGAAGVWHHGGVYMRNGVGWVALSFEGVGGKHVLASCHVSSPKGPATMKITRDGSVVTKPLAKGVQDVSINVPNAPDAFTVELKVDPVDAIEGSEIGWLLYSCEMESS